LQAFRPAATTPARPATDLQVAPVPQIDQSQTHDQRIAAELGPWSWWIIGLVFLGLEILIPGVFLLWIGLRHWSLALCPFMFWDMAAWSWQMQVLIFAVLSLAFALIGRRVSAPAESDQPMLNRRVEGLVGRTATLEEPISEGKGDPA
jgi:membrane protein implicated in regulation of membrane protease activity